MHPFSRPIVKVAIPDAIQKRAQHFAKAVITTVDYSDAHQKSCRKIHHDHWVSKVGEEAVKLAFEQHSRSVKGPDYKIYDAPEKSWDADLYVDGIPLAVKTQTQAMANRFGLSWTFQAGSQSGRRDPILDTPEAWVCFVKYDEAVQMCWVYSPRQIETLRFGEPRLAKLWGFKKVVYADNLLSNF
ncbi:MAG: hypothetical protein AAGA67_02885 [Cyanobacteria bacterium P01_F01_bin.153]